MRHRSPIFRPLLIGCVALPLLALALPARAADDKPTAQPQEKRVAAGICVTETASLMRREAPDKPWQVVKEGDELFTGDQTMGGVHGALDTRDGAVRLIVVGDVDGLSPIPVLETSFVLHEPSGVDLDFTFERGRVRLINLKKSGPAQVRLRVRQNQYEFTLAEPGTTVTLELFGRWPAGVPFRKERKAGEEPALVWAVLVVKGEVHLKGPRRELTLKAPPGPALLMGDSVADPEPQPGFLKELPDWCPERLSDLGGTEKGKKVLAIVARWRKQAIEKGVGPAIEGFLHSDDPLERRLAVLWLGATDDQERMAAVLKETKHQDVWDAGIIALRNWIGRGPGQDQKLYKGLMQLGKLSPVEAAGVLDLLHSFGDEDLAQPETYQVLINYLGSERLSLRQLTYWHLKRLVPGGLEIGYDPLAPKEKRDAAIKAWRALVPPGTVPGKKKNGGQ
jgi:hypothetical protein